MSPSNFITKAFDDAKNSFCLVQRSLHDLIFIKVVNSGEKQKNQNQFINA